MKTKLFNYGRCRVFLDESFWDSHKKSSVSVLKFECLKTHYTLERLRKEHWENIRGNNLHCETKFLKLVKIF